MKPDQKTIQDLVSRIRKAVEEIDHDKCLTKEGRILMIKLYLDLAKVLTEIEKRMMEL